VATLRREATFKRDRFREADHQKRPFGSNFH
jgi:hypothetical protein